MYKLAILASPPSVRNEKRLFLSNKGHLGPLEFGSLIGQP